MINVDDYIKTDTSNPIHIFLTSQLMWFKTNCHISGKTFVRRIGYLIYVCACLKYYSIWLNFLNASIRLCCIIALTSQNFSFDLNEMKDKLKIRLGKLNMERAIIIIFWRGVGWGVGFYFFFKLSEKPAFSLYIVKQMLRGINHVKTYSC